MGDRVRSANVTRRCIFCGGTVETHMMDGQVATVQHGAPACERWRAGVVGAKTMEEILALTVPPAAGSA